MERPQCSNPQLFRNKWPDRAVDPLDWKQFFRYEEAFIHKVDPKHNPDPKTFHRRLEVLSGLLDADDPYFPE